jgi:hypothetical protein
MCFTFASKIYERLQYKPWLITEIKIKPAASILSACTGWYLNLRE